MKMAAFCSSLVVCSVAVFVTTNVVITYSNSVVTFPYMDEIFHVDQMQRYCAGNFSEWNPKITTPPGLYLLAYAVLAPFLTILGADSVCTVQILRHLNCVSTLLIFWVAAIIARSQFSLSDERSGKPNTACVFSVLATALAVTFLPVLCFTSLLFYTDQLSLFFVLLTVYLSLAEKRHIAASVVGFMGLFMRQTNIVWVAFCGMVTTANILEQCLTIQRKKKSDDDIATSSGHLPNLLSLLADGVVRRRPALASAAVTTARHVWPYACVGVAFVGFVVRNGGVVLGDKTAHVAVVHPPQFYYYCCFMLFFGAPYLLLHNGAHSLTRSVRTLLRHKLVSLLSLLLIVVSVHLGTHVHPYLLADNRHYTFYIWRRWFMRHPAAKFVPAPGYLFGVVVLWQSLKRQSQVWRLAYVLCTLAVTVPNRLLELRYFIVPYVIWRLHVNQGTRAPPVWNACVELAYYAAINAATMWLFWQRPFVWQHEPEGVQRFMW